VCHEVVKIEAKTAANQAGGSHVGERRQVRVEAVPLLDLPAERHRVLEHRRVMPHHLDSRRYVAEHLRHHKPIETVPAIRDEIRSRVQSLVERYGWTRE